MNLWNENNPFMKALTTLSNLILLNWLFLLCCIPVVTIGAALTGMHRVILEMHRGEDGAIVKSYFRGMKDNFGKATIIWLILLLLGAVLLVDFWFAPRIVSNRIITAALPAAAVMALLWLMELIYAFPLLARYQASASQILKKAILIGIGSFPQTLILSAIILAVPYLCLRYPSALPMLLLISMFLLFSGIVYLCDWLINRIFRKMISEA